jgi:hypothetical protein
MDYDYFLCLRTITSIGGFTYEQGKIYKFSDASYPKVRTSEILQRLNKVEVIVEIGKGTEIVDVVKYKDITTRRKEYGLSV